MDEEFELPDGSYSVSDIQDYIKYIIKKHETFPTNPLMHIYISRTNNRVVLKINDEYNLELQTPETMKLFGSTKNLISKTRNGENVPSLEAIVVALVECDLVDNLYQQNFEMLYTSTPNTSYASVLNAEPSNLAFLKTYNIEFDKINITLTIKMIDH